MPDLRITLTATVNSRDIPGYVDGVPAVDVDQYDLIAEVLEQDGEIGGVPLRNITMEDCDELHRPGRGRRLGRPRP